MPRKATDSSILPTERIEKCILLIRGQRVMLDRDLASLYDVPTKALKQAVRRNIVRFPEDFMFELTKEEFEVWRSQFVTSKGEGDGGEVRRAVQSGIRCTRRTNDPARAQEETDWVPRGRGESEVRMSGERAER
ncbi:MAG: ORF6N domain-containing protein [Kiritimatiellae bacterium]|nr:ORF6N domain-containing protein [Kiritimatiellia bacterium]